MGSHKPLVKNIMQKNTVSCGALNATVVHCGSSESNWSKQVSDGVRRKANEWKDKIMRSTVKLGKNVKTEK